jgi:hypothetical protein
MQKNALNKCIALVVLGCLGTPAVAADLKIGNPETNLGELSISGFLRAKYQDKSWSDKDHKLTFDAAKINVDYKSPKVLGHIEYRCYRFDKLCDFSTLVDAYAGYNINEKHYIQVGLQPVPFGPGRFWESNNYGGIVTQVGLEDVHDIGVKYQGKFDTGTTLELGYFSRDGGAYSSPYAKDASRYTSNYVKSEYIPGVSDLDEKNMFIGRVQQEIGGLPEGITTSVGASYWYSDIDNKSTNKTGERKAWAAFGNFAYNDLALILTVGQNDVTNKDPNNPDSSVMGSFGDNYLVANKGTFYTADVSYTFKDVGKFDSITTYAMYSSFDKKEKGYPTSTRNIIGAAASYKDLTFFAEYIMGKNDAMLSRTDTVATAYSTGGDKGTNKLVNLQVAYYF